MNLPERALSTVMIVGDSPAPVQGLTTLFESSQKFSVVGEASNGAEAVEKARALHPNLITMDLPMIEGGGLEAIEEIMAECPTPILVVTGISIMNGLDDGFEAISRGALEIIPKPELFPGSPEAHRTLIETAERLTRVPVTAHARASVHPRFAQPPRQTARSGPEETEGPVIVMGASTGGPGALREILSNLPRDFPAPIVAVQHLSDAFTLGFIYWLESQILLDVEEARPGVRIEAGKVYLAIRGSHLQMTADRTLVVSRDERRGHGPSIDILFESAARALGPQAIGVLLTGMGTDGALGLKEILDGGGSTLAQEKDSCAVFRMPKEAIDRGAVRTVLAPSEISSELIRMTAKDRR